MDDAALVRRGETRTDLRDDERRARLAHRVLGGERLEEVFALRELHRDERVGPVDAVLVNLDRVRVLEERRGLGLAVEPAEHRRIAGQLAVDDLERDLFARVLTRGDLGRVHGRHSAPTDAPVDAEPSCDRATYE